jgi:hypothetical protein
MKRGKVWITFDGEELELEFFLTVSESVIEYLNQVVILLSHLCLV